MSTSPPARRSVVLALVAAALCPASALAFDQGAEVKNAAKSQERQAIYETPAYQAALSAQGTKNLQEALTLGITDPERVFSANVCGSKDGACAGDIRLDDWKSRGYGEVEPILFTARNGATLAGHVWATRAGPQKRPAIVIVNGSVQASEELYWYAAQTLAKAGYIVITFDPQGQGRSDVNGEGADTLDGVPSQTDGTAFFDGAQDALDFLLSTPDKPYVPRPSRTSGTSHAAKQARRVAAHLDTAYDPFYARVDPTRIGIAGHSYGAQGASWLGQQDPRIKAVVAWDNLCVPTPDPKGLDSQDPTALGNGGLPRECLKGGALPAPKITKPALGITGDYVFAPVPLTSAPDAAKRGAASREYTAAGVDTGEIVIRGGTHLDFSFLPLRAFPATLRGEDLIAWYTTAWFDRYVKGDASADARILTDRWRDDAPGAAVDADHDGNLYSADYRSRLDLHTADGTAVDCEDLRAGCPALGDDGRARPYSVIGQVLSGDGAPDAAPPPPCTSRRTILVTLPGTHIRTVRATVGGKAAKLARVGRHQVRVDLRGLPKASILVTLRATVVMTSGKARTVTQVRRFRTCTPGS